MERRKVTSLVGLSGKFIAEFLIPGTDDVVDQQVIPNVVTNGGKNLLARMLLNQPSVSVGLTYQAVGLGVTDATERDTQLETETQRRLITTRGDTASEIATFFTYFAGSSITVVLQELGIFGHITASSTPNSGVLFARTRATLDNLAGHDLLLSYVLTVT